jgi:hypothetical protein
MGGPASFCYVVGAVVLVLVLIPVLCRTVKWCPGYRRDGPNFSGNVARRGNKGGNSNGGNINNRNGFKLSRGGSQLALVKVSSLEYGLLAESEHSGHRSSARMDGSGGMGVKSYVARLYCTGINAPELPWALPVQPPPALAHVVNASGFTEFATEFNGLASFTARQRAVRCLLRFLPLLGDFYLWRQRRRKAMQLVAFVQQCEHTFFTSARARHIRNSLIPHASEDGSLFSVDVVDVEAAERYPVGGGWGGGSAFVRECCL